MDYDHLKPISGESKYVDFDQDTGMFGIFGDESGFCYQLFMTKEEAEETKQELNYNA